MKKLITLKAGTTFPATRQQYGDFNDWIARSLEPSGLGVQIVDAQRGDALPAPESCAGVVITGSHAMVTDNEPWSLHIETWLMDLLAAQVPILGICYGHQLLGRAAGGQVNYHPQGREIGTTTIKLLADAAHDPLFGDLPASFLAHTTHAQSVLDLPEGAIHLAASGHDPHHAFRLGPCAWGVQFHPEFDADIMRAYIQQQADALVAAGRDVPSLINKVTDTPVATQILMRFGQYVRSSPGNVSSQAHNKINN